MDKISRSEASYLFHPHFAEVKHKLTKKIHHQLITSCVLFPEKKEDEYIYVGDLLRRTFGVFIFWKKRKELSIKDRLIGNLLK